MRKTKLRRVAALFMAGILMAGSIFYQDGLSVNAAVDGKIIAFPGAEGGGKYASGGRGYDVYTVNTLEDYKANETPIVGSLRHAVESSIDGRMIVFNVGGVIMLKQSLRFDGKKNITIAGQTAPGDGITIGGYDTNISNSENLIIRFVRFRVGATNVFMDGADSFDALWGRDNKTFIIDHCSFSWNTDECVSLYRGLDGTVQWSIISESLTVSGHSKGRHGYGGIFGGENVLFQYNLIANHTSRNPRIGGGSMGDPTKDGSTSTLQVSNNVLYNWGYFSMYGGGYAYTNYMNNYLKAGLGTRASVADRFVDAGESTKPGGFYVSGNYLEGNAAFSANNSLGIKFSGSTIAPNITEMATTPYIREGFNNISLVSAQTAYPLVANKVGATYPRRDAIDARVISETLNDKGMYVNTEDEVGGYASASVSRDVDFDTDNDGIPNYWETARGLNPADATDSKTLSSNGYSNLELYINSLVDGVTAANYVAPNPTVTINVANNTQFKVGQSIDVTATAIANNGGSIAKVEFYKGATIVGTDTVAPFTNSYTGLGDGSYPITVRAYDNAGNATQSSTSKVHVNSTATSGTWTSLDIGNPGVAGSASLTDGVLTVKGAGKLGRAEGSVSGGAWYDASKDNFQYTYKQISGDTEIITKLDSFTTVDCHAFNGIMFRETLAADSKAAALGVSLVKINSSTSWSTYLAGRNTTGGNMSEITESIDSKAGAIAAGLSIVTDIEFKTGPTFNGAWLKLARKGDVFTAFYAMDGVNWVEIGSRTVEMAESIYVGFAVDANKVANNINNFATAKFSNIKIVQEMYNINTNLANLTLEGSSNVAKDADFIGKIKPVAGYNCPNNISITVGGVATTNFTYDKTTGNLVIPNVTGEVIITAAGSAVIINMADYAPVEVDPSNLLTADVTTSKITLTQTATTGAITGGFGIAGINTSYFLFPKSKDINTMSMRVKVTAQSTLTDKAGLFIGAFQTEAPYSFSTLAFRGNTTDTLCPYWVKKTSVGNGSPKFNFTVGHEFDLTFDRNADGSYDVAFVDLNDATVKGTKLFKLSEQLLDANSVVQFGFGLVGVTAEITGLTYKDVYETVLYSQENSTKVFANYTAVNSAIERANLINPLLYSNFDAVTKAINAVTLGLEATSQATVDGYVTAINAAIDGLTLVPANYANVDDAIAIANALTASNYKDFTAVTAAIAAVQRGLLPAEQAKVDGFAAAIHAAVAALDRVVIDNGNTSDDIKLVDNNNYVPDNAVLAVEVVTSGTNFEKAKEAIVKISNKEFVQVAVVEINLTDASNVAITQLNGYVSVTIPVPAGIDASKPLSIYRVELDGTLTKLDTKIIDGKIVFETNHFSTYIIAEVNEKAGLPPVVVPDNTNTDNTNTNNTNNSNTNNTSSTVPGTGDNTPMTIYMIIMGISLGTLTLIVKKKRVKRV